MKRGYPARPPEDRFWEKVDKSGECWEWQAGHTVFGYGVFFVKKHQPASAHRWSFEQIHGKIPDGMLVCHKCDNPKCVNPDHLFLGTHSDNMQDMHAKGRAGKPPRNGTNNGRAKLNWDQARSIREKYRVGDVSQQQLANQFGVTKTMVRQIIKHRAWKEQTA